MRDYEALTALMEDVFFANEATQALISFLPYEEAKPHLKEDPPKMQFMEHRLPYEEENVQGRMAGALVNALYKAKAAEDSAMSDPEHHPEGEVEEAMLSYAANAMKAYEELARAAALAYALERDDLYDDLWLYLNPDEDTNMADNALEMCWRIIDDLPVETWLRQSGLHGRLEYLKDAKEERESEKSTSMQAGQ